MKSSRITVIVLLAVLSILIFTATKEASAAVKTAILPYKIISAHHRGYSYIAGSIPLILSSEIASDRIEIARNADVATYSRKSGINFSSAGLSKLAKHFKADFIIYGRIVKIGGTFIIQSNLFDAQSGKVAYRGHIQVTGTRYIIAGLDKQAAALKNKIESIKPAARVIKKENISTAVVSTAAPVAVISSASPASAPPATPESSIFLKRFVRNGGGLVRTESKTYVIKAVCAGKFMPE